MSNQPLTGKKTTADVLPASPATFTGQQSVRIRYYKGFTPDKIQLTINGKVIAAPPAPANPKMQAIDFEITKENIQQIWQSGVITFDTPAAPNANTNPANVKPVNTAPR